MTHDSRNRSKAKWFRLGVCLSSGIGFFTGLMAYTGSQRWPVAAMASLGAVFFIISAWDLGVMKAPYKFGVLIRTLVVSLIVCAVMAVLALKVWPSKATQTSELAIGPHVALGDFAVDSAGLDSLTLHSEVENIGTSTALDLESSGTCLAAPRSRDSEDRIFELLEQKPPADAIYVKTRDLEPGPSQRFWEQMKCPIPDSAGQTAIRVNKAVWYFVIFDTYADSHGARWRVERCFYIEAADPRIDNMLFHICGGHNQTVKTS